MIMIGFLIFLTISFLICFMLSILVEDKDQILDLTEKVKDKVQDIKDDTINVNYTSSGNEKKEDNVYTYTVKFDEEDESKEN